MSSRENTVLRGRFRYQLDLQGFRCPLSGAVLALRSAVLLDASLVNVRVPVAVHEDAWDRIRLAVDPEGRRSARGRDLFPLVVPGDDRELRQEPGPHLPWSTVRAEGEDVA